MKKPKFKLPRYFEPMKKALETGYSVDPVRGLILAKDGKPLKMRVGNGKAYPTVNMFVKGFGREKWNIAAHKVMAFTLFGEEAFAPGIHVRHLDANRMNIKATNLALGTASMNAFDKPPEVRRAMAKKARAAQGPAWNRKFSDEEADIIRRLCRQYGDQSAIARLLGVDRTTICSIVKGRKYRKDAQ